MSVKFGFNARTTMFDKDDALAYSQLSALRSAGGKSIYYAVQDDEFDWFNTMGGKEYRNRFFRLARSFGMEIIFPFVDSNFGVEASVKSSIWQLYLSDRNGDAPLARKDLIGAIIRTRHLNGWSWLLMDVMRKKNELGSLIDCGVIGCDAFAFHTDAYINPAPMDWKRLTPAGEAKVKLLGPIASGDPFADMENAIERITGKPVLRDCCFVYDEGVGPRVTAKNGALTTNVLEFGVNTTLPDAAFRLEYIISMLKASNISRALLHVPIDPSLAWFWKTVDGTSRLWSDAGYEGVGSRHPYTCWPAPDLREAVLRGFGA